MKLPCGQLEGSALRLLPHKIDTVLVKSSRDLVVRTWPGNRKHPELVIELLNGQDIISRSNCNYNKMVDCHGLLWDGIGYRCPSTITGLHATI